MEEEFYNQILQYIISNSYIGPISETLKKKIRRNAKGIIVKDRLLYKQCANSCVLLIKQGQTAKILQECHDNIGGHKGIHATYGIIKERYFWPNMFEEIKHYVQSCKNCQAHSNYSIKATRPLEPILVTSKAWYLCGMDLVGPLVPSNGYNYFLAMTDYFTKYVATRLLKTKEAAEVSSGIFSIYCQLGAPVRIITDNGTSFTSKVNL